VDEVALIRDTISHYAPVLIAPLSIQIRRAGVQKLHQVANNLTGRVSLASLVVVEAPAAELLRECGDQEHYRAFRRMTESYFADFAGGNVEAIAAMIDFYGGVGTFASWPPRVRAYAVETTAVNILDWASAYDFPLSAASLAAVEVPVLVLWGGKTHPAAQRANALLSGCLSRAASATIDDATHFMIATHAIQVSRLIAQHVRGAEESQCSFGADA
jgi:pimeloyl-ACP methyl ester carboxylesterase